MGGKKEKRRVAARKKKEGWGRQEIKERNRGEHKKRKGGKKQSHLARSVQSENNGQAVIRALKYQSVIPKIWFFLLPSSSSRDHERRCVGEGGRGEGGRGLG